jgi:hypothetical protein
MCHRTSLLLLSYFNQSLPNNFQPTISHPHSIRTKHKSPNPFSNNTTMSSTSTNPATSTSETSGNSLYPKDSVPAAEVSTQESKVGQTDVNQGSAEKAAEKLYEGE